MTFSSKVITKFLLIHLFVNNFILFAHLTRLQFIHAFILFFHLFRFLADVIDCFSKVVAFDGGNHEKADSCSDQQRTKGHFEESGINRNEKSHPFKYEEGETYFLRSVVYTVSCKEKYFCEVDDDNPEIVVESQK